MICIPRVCLVSRAGRRSWRRADLPARGVGAAQCIGRPVPAGMCQARSAAPAADILAAVTNDGRARDPRTAGTAWGGCMEPGPGHAGHRDAGLGVWLGLLAAP